MNMCPPENSRYETPGTAPVADHPPLTDDPRITVGLLLSAPYSGATLLSILLNQHSLISCDGEIFPPTRGKHVLCSCGVGQIECDYYRHVCQHMIEVNGDSWNTEFFGYLPRYSTYRALDRALAGFWTTNILNRLRNDCCRFLPSLHRLDTDFISAHERLFSRSLQIRKARVYVDGTKQVRRAEMLTASEKFNIRMIHLIRDGRGFCNSYLKNKQLHRPDLRKAAKIWLNNIKKVDIYHARFPKTPLIHVRYEDLCRNPQHTLGDICHFLDLPYDDSMESTHSKPCHIIGNRMRKSFKGSIYEDLSWKTHLRTHEINQITQIMKRDLQRFNYI